MQKQAVYDKERDIREGGTNIAMADNHSSGPVTAILTAPVSAVKTMTVPTGNATPDPMAEAMKSITKKLSELNSLVKASVDGKTAEKRSSGGMCVCVCVCVF